MKDFSAVLGIDLDFSRSIVKQHISNLMAKVETELAKHVGHLSPEEIKKRCKCEIRGMLYTYYLDDKPLFEVDFEPKIAT